MRKTILPILLVILLCAGIIHPVIVSTDKKDSNPIAAQADDELYFTETPQEHIASFGESLGYADNELIVYFKDNATQAQKQSVFDTLGAHVIGHTSIINKYQLQLPEKKSFAGLLALCAKVNLRKSVALASCNMALQLKEDVVPDDPWEDEEGNHYANWDESNVSNGNWWLTATQLPSAWENEKYFHPIRIGILDSGFEVDHEDLQGKISFPSKFHQKANRPESHGTHVAGIISANANNKIGITGICNNAELMCVDWQPDENSNQVWSTNERIFTGFISLVRSGAKVINMSLGSSGSFKEEEKWKWNFTMYLEGMLFSFTMSKLLQHGYDFVMVQSAGNGMKNGDPCDSYYNGSFCAITKRNAFTGIGRIKKQDILDRIIVVGSSTYAHNKDVFYQSSFSNYGDGVSIFAPGSWVYSTVLKEEGKYGYKSGTSMAAPNVTGITALTWSVNPDLTGSQIKKIVCDPDNTIYTVRNYYNDTMEIPDYRMINAKRSVEAAIATLNLPQEPELTTDISEKTTESEPSHTVINAADNPILSDKSDEKIIEQFRGEIGE